MRNASFQHLKSPVGVLKIIHVIFGGICIALVVRSYVPVLRLKLFLGFVTACLGISFIFLVAHIIWNDFFRKNRATKTFSLVFHILGGIILVIAGIDLDGWSEFDLNCEQDCLDIYTIGVSKILAFINGILYGIAAFLEVKEDEPVDEYTEVLPLILVQDSKCYEDDCRSNVISLNSSIHYNRYN